MFLPAVALVLILLSTLMIWTNIEQRSLFGLYMIQVKNKISNENFKISSDVWDAGYSFCFCCFQVAGVSLQGFLNSMVYAWRRPNFTEAVLGENTPLVAQAPLAFFDESLRSSLWLFTLNASRDTVVLRKTTYRPPEEDWPHACTLHDFMSI